MAIKESLKFITIKEFKAWDGFNEVLFDEITAPDSDITTAIIIATSNIDYLTGFSISKIWPDNSDNPPSELIKLIENIKIATAIYTRYLISKGDPDYLMGQASISQGGITYSQSNPEDPYFIPPEIFNYLREIEQYNTFKGFNIDKIVNPKNNPLADFMGLGGEINLLEQYLMIVNMLDSESISIERINQPNIRGSRIKFNINSSILPKTLWSETDDFVYLKNAKPLTLNKQPIFEVQDYDNENSVPSKGYVDKTNDKLDEVIDSFSKELERLDLDLNDIHVKELPNKQNKLIDSESIKIENNSPSVDLENVHYTATHDQLKTTNKTIVGGINEVHTTGLNNYNDIQTLKENKQNIKDDSLTTSDKTIVGAINEIANNSGAVSPWIIGEYKYMPYKQYEIGMPDGWIEIRHDISNFVYYVPELPSIFIRAEQHNSSSKFPEPNSGYIKWTGQNLGEIYTVEDKNGNEQQIFNRWTIPCSVWQYNPKEWEWRKNNPKEWEKIQEKEIKRRQIEIDKILKN